MHDDDAELVARSRARDASAFGVLVARHQGLVKGVALARCGDPALADDVVQDAFITAWRSLDNLRDDAAIGPWVAGIARNLAANALRSRARHAVDPGDAIEVVPSPEEAAIEHEDRALLLRSLADVPEAFRDVLVRYYLDGDSIAGIARALGVREDLVKQRLSRGRTALRELVAARVDSALLGARKRRAGLFAGAGKAFAAMTGKQITIGVVIALVAAGGAVWLATHRGGDSSSPAPAPGSAGGSAVATAPPIASDAATAAAKPRVQRADPAKRAQLLDSIRQSRTTRAPAGASSVTPAPTLGSADSGLSRDYIRDSVRELIPMLTECYETALVRDPKLAGNMVVDFTIEGEPGVGGVISESAINTDKTTIADPEMRECIQETMYGIQIDAPKDGVRVNVTYPFAFSPAGQDPPP